jgi:hypothetical protein
MTLNTPSGSDVANWQHNFNTLKGVGVTTLALGSQPKQGFTRVRAKREARESHLMFPRV